MKKMHKLGLAAAMLVSAQVATAGSIPNIGFESGLTGWTAVPGDGSSTVSVQNSGANISGVTVTANEGNSFGAISGSGALLTFANLVAGDTYGFAYRFITNEYVGFNDSALAYTGNQVTLLASVNQSGNQSPNTYDSGWKNFFFTSAITAPSATIMFNLFNEKDTALNSNLLIDAAVPLPAAAWLFGSALLGAGALRRKQKAEKKAALAVA